MFHLIPEQLLASELEPVLGEDAHSRTQFPQAELVEIVGGVALDIGMHMELFIKLSQKESFVKYPSRGIPCLVNFPAFGYDTVFDDAGVRNQRIDTPGGHDGHRVLLPNCPGSVLHLFLARQ